MITEFTLETFRSYQRATLPLSTLTLLIGANASGKSNALEGLRVQWSEPALPSRDYVVAGIDWRRGHRLGFFGAMARSRVRRCLLPLLRGRRGLGCMGSTCTFANCTFHKFSKKDRPHRVRCERIA